MPERDILAGNRDRQADRSRGREIARNKFAKKATLSVREANAPFDFGLKIGIESNKLQVVPCALLRISVRILETGRPIPEGVSFISLDADTAESQL